MEFHLFIFLISVITASAVSYYYDMLNFPVFYINILIIIEFKCKFQQNSVSVISEIDYSYGPDTGYRTLNDGNIIPVVAYGTFTAVSENLCCFVLNNTLC